MNPSTTIPMKGYRRQLSIHVVIDKDILKINQNTRFPFFILLSKTGVGLPKTGLGFCDKPSICDDIIIHFES